MTIHPEILALLRQTRYEPGARRGYNHLAGGFLWSDEFPAGFWETAVRLDDWSDRELIAHRAAIILGKDTGRFLATWQEVERGAPDWPGLRPERRCPGLSAELLAKIEEVDAGLEELDRKIRRRQRPRTGKRGSEDASDYVA